MRIIILILVSFLLPNLVSAFTIVSPKEGTQITAGSDVKVQVKADAGEKLLAVKMLLQKDEDFQFNPATGFYEKTIQIRPDIDIGVITIDAAAINDQGKELTTAIKVLVILPPTVTLQGIRIRDDHKYLFMETNDKEKIRVYGKYSDGVERDVSSTATGTTYTTSDEKIAVADSNGLVTAVAPGTAKITIKNGKNEITVVVDVKPKK